MNLRIFLTVALLFFLATVSVVHAEEPIYTEEVNLTFHASKHFKLDENISRIFMGSSAIAKVHQLPPSLNEFVVTAAGTEGETTLFVWTVDGAMYEYSITVTKEEYGSAKAIEDAIGLPNVHVKKVGGKVLLSGTVKNQYERNYAIQTARLFVGSGTKSSLTFGSNTDTSLSSQSSTSSSGGGLAENNKVEDDGNVIDLLKMTSPTQIKLEAQIISINPSDVKRLGFDYGGSSPAEASGIFFAGESYGSGDSFKTNPIRWITDRRSPINMRLDALISNNKAKLLSRPNITTMSGEEASIHVGGRIPYTTYRQDQVDIHWENYGIILQLKPVVDAENRIVSAIHAEVSSLSGESVDGYPIIERRRADSVVTMLPGSTMIIGGLMDSSERKLTRKIPLLGDIPILGEFFKYSSTTKNKQELIILVTPYIIDEYDSSRADMSDSMKDYYHDDKREREKLNKVDVNDPPPPESEVNDKKYKN